MLINIYKKVIDDNTILSNHANKGLKPETIFEMWNSYSILIKFLSSKTC